MGDTRGFGRLAQVYATVERVREAELLAAAHQAAEVVRAGERASERWRREMGAGRAALLTGDPLGRLAAEAEQRAAAVHRAAMEELRRQTEAERARAEAVHRESRVQSEQIEEALLQQRAERDREHARRMQAAADDRYLSRREWMRAQDARRTASMNAG